MSTIDTRSISKLTLDVRGLIRANPSFINDIAGYSLFRMLYFNSKITRLSRLSRRQLRKLRNIRRRWFVDNVVMHHKRIHDFNSRLILQKSNVKAIIKKDSTIKRSITLCKSRNKDQDNYNWQDNIMLRERGAKIRGRIDSRRLRARSRWVSIIS